VLPIRFNKDRAHSANCRTFQPTFGTCNFKSIFRTVPGKLGQIVTLSGAEQPLLHVPSWCTETELYVWIVFSECLSCLWNLICPRWWIWSLLFAGMWCHAVHHPFFTVTLPTLNFSHCMSPQKSVCHLFSPLILAHSIRSKSSFL